MITVGWPLRGGKGKKLNKKKNNKKKKSLPNGNKLFYILTIYAIVSLLGKYSKSTVHRITVNNIHRLKNI